MLDTPSCILRSVNDFLVRGSDYLLTRDREFIKAVEENDLNKQREIQKKGAAFKLVGRENDLERLFAALTNNKSNNVLLTGFGGVGLSALCMGLQAAKNDPNSPLALDTISKPMFWLDTDALFSSGDHSKINDSFQKILKTLSRNPETILVIEDTKDFFDGARQAGCSHFVNALMNHLRKGKFQAILECRDEDLGDVMKTHSDLREIFTLLEVQEPDPESLKLIVGEAVKGLERHHGIKIAPEAVDMAIKLTTQYPGVREMSLSRAQPERAINLLSRTMTSYRMESHKNPPELAALKHEQAIIADALSGKKIDDSLAGRSKEELESLKAVNESNIAEYAATHEATQKQLRRIYGEQRAGEERLRQLDEEIEALKLTAAKEQKELADKAGQKAAEFNVNAASAGLKDDAASGLEEMAENSGFEMSPQIRARQEEVNKAQTVVRKYKQQYKDMMAAVNEKLLLQPTHILGEFSTLSGIPANKLDQDERQKILNLEGNLSTRVFGQDHAIKKVSDGVMMARSGLKDPGKPDSAFLFLGPSGVGKTELSKALNAALFDDEKTMVRFDMSEYMEKHSVAKLIGTPPGYEGFRPGGLLTEAIRKNPRCVLLLDEVEKAHPEVLDIFLQVLDDGRLSDNVGRTASFKDVTIIVTSNIGSNHFLNRDLTEEEAREAAMQELAEKYRPEFLNRFEGRRNIVGFKRLELPSIEKIVRREINTKNKLIQDKGLAVTMSDGDIKGICKDYYQDRDGARGIRGYFNTEVWPVLARHIIEKPDSKGTVTVTYDSETKKPSVELPDASAVNRKKGIGAPANDLAPAFAARAPG